jgi:hypothetical protein
MRRLVYVLFLRVRQHQQGQLALLAIIPSQSAQTLVLDVELLYVEVAEWQEGYW